MERSSIADEPGPQDSEHPPQGQGTAPEASGPTGSGHEEPAVPGEDPAGGANPLGAPEAPPRGPVGETEETGPSGTGGASGTPDTGKAAQAAAGWYADPRIAGVKRYWDGAEWTSHTEPSDVAALLRRRSIAQRIVGGAILAILAVLSLCTLAFILSADMVGCGPSGETRGGKETYECATLASKAIGSTPLILDWLASFGWSHGLTLTIIAAALIVLRMTLPALKPGRASLINRPWLQLAFLGGLVLIVVLGSLLWLVAFLIRGLSAI